MIYRELEKKLISSAKQIPVVAILGPRQSGKTTLAKSVFKKHNYVSLENLDIRNAAKEDPYKFLESNIGKHGVILDEIQNAPELFSYIQTHVDTEDWQRLTGSKTYEDINGKFIITGSQNFLVNESITQTLAGRIYIHTLLPLSISELKNSSLLPENLNSVIFKGGYPRIFSEKVELESWIPTYIRTYIERDVRQLKNISNLSLFQDFIKLCAGRIGQVLNITSLSDDCGISTTTLNSWISILEASYVIFKLKPYYKNFSKRLIKSPKIYFYDTALACNLLEIKSPEQIYSHYLRGGLFENLILSEIHKQYFNNGLLPNTYFWRDKTGNEIDCLIDTAKKPIPIEIKGSKTPASKFFDTIQYWYDLSGSKEKDGIVIYAGDQNQKRTHGQIISWNSVDKIIKKFMQ